MQEYFCQEFSKDAWSYIRTSFWGEKIIANKCGLSIKELKSTIQNSRDSQYLNNLLYVAGARVAESHGELFVQPDYTDCPGSIRLVSGNTPIDTLITLCEDFTCGGDICEYDTYRVLELSQNKYVVIHHDGHTHIIEINQSWKHFDKVEELLIKQTENLQTEGKFTQLSIAILVQFLRDCAEISNPYGHLDLIKKLNNIAPYLASE